MSAKKPKFYVVWRGVRPGVYDNWDDASRQVSGFPGAQYKSFSSRAEAETAFRGAYSSYAGFSAKLPVRTFAQLQAMGVDPGGLAVDAACSGVPGPMEYRGVWLAGGDEAFRAGPFDDGTNNVGEFLAIVHAASMLHDAHRPEVVIYSDSENAIKWVAARECRTNLAETDRNGVIFEKIAEALWWLKDHRIANPIRKWETEQWGENPADFGRK